MEAALVCRQCLSWVCEELFGLKGASDEIVMGWPLIPNFMDKSV